jgi:hypothetical protein
MLAGRLPGAWRCPRFAFDACGEERRRTAVVVAAVALPTGGRSSKLTLCSAMYFMKSAVGVRDDAIGVLAAFVVEALHAEGPDDLHPGVAAGREGVGDRDHAAERGVAVSAT